MQLMHSENKWEKETISPLSQTMHVSSNWLWHKSQRKQTFRNCVTIHCVYERRLLFLKELSFFTSVIFSALCPGVFQDQYLKCVVLCLSVFFHELIFLRFSPSLTLRFADSIRGMLKLILVLMLAGASLSSTWFTLTCLSRVTHLPSTAGGSTAASLSRWHCKHAVQLIDSETAQSQNEFSWQIRFNFSIFSLICKINSTLIL